MTARLSAAGKTRFRSIALASAGIHFDDAKTGEGAPEAVLPGDYARGTSGGVCLGDFDNDGLSDLFVTHPHGGGHRLFRNRGEFQFEDVTEKSGVAGVGMAGRGATFVDIDNDGDLDLYVCGYAAANRLYINNGDGTFTDRAAQYGLDFLGASVSMAFADYDRDGDLDGYLATYRLAPEDPPDPIELKITFSGDKAEVPAQYREVVDVVVRPDGAYKLVAAGQRDHLFRNNGDGSFTDVSEEAGIDGSHQTWSALWWDYDDDQWPDLYVANDFYGPDHLYRNQGDGTFTDVAPSSLPSTPWFSMGSAAGDLNNDGLLDLVASDMAGTTHYKSKIGMGAMGAETWFLQSAQPRQYMRNMLYVNSGVGRFLEAARMAGVAATDWTWSVKLADFDADGLLDLFVTNGMTRDLMNSDLTDQARTLTGAEATEFWTQQGPKRDRNLAFRNSGNFTFQNVSAEWGLDDLGVSFASVAGDLDGDGDLDLVITGYDQPLTIYDNQSTESHSLTVRLVGSRSNRWGLGSKVTLHTPDGVQTRLLHPVSGFMSSDGPLLHFGLGEAERVQRLTIHWPSGCVQEFRDLSADQNLTIVEPDDRQEGSPDDRRKVPLYHAAPSPVSKRHQETPYDDFVRQPLLPNRYSQLGPGLAWCESRADGAMLVYRGGAAWQTGDLYYRIGAGPWMHVAHGPWNDDALAEDMGALWFDADADGDLDLYVVSGGVECHRDDPVLQDRLYLNDGEMRFHKAAEALPEMRTSGSAVAAGDYDRDGDLDLFVGGRIIPGEYPLAPRSYLLRNDGGKFSDVTDAIVPQVRNTGLVTSAIWSDANNDGWVDLLVTHEWGPVKLFRNEVGKGQGLVDGSKRAGTADLLGWWNGIAAADVDHDGDIDYAVTNFGLNTKYHADFRHPVQLYYGDFEGNGRMHLVEAEYEENTLFPVRGKSCSTSAMPILRDKFTTYHDFALATVEEIYSKDKLHQAHSFTCNTLESGVLINDGQGRFEFQPLPRIAQIAPGFGVAFVDVNGDGHPDLYLVQNFYSPQLETGRMSGGVSMLLVGDGQGHFAPVWPNESGLVVGGDAKSLIVVDLNDDARPDFVVGVNDDKVQAFVHSGPTGEERAVRLRLHGKQGNPDAVGARVVLKLADGSQHTAEVYAGGGYLSQSPAAIWFGTNGSSPQLVSVRWPDGSSSTHDEFMIDASTLEISKP